MELPVIRIAGEERWDCQACGVCCRGAIVLLNDTDLERIREQKWEEDPIQAGKAYLARDSRATSGYRLAQRADGCCVFLTDGGRSRVHEKFGFENKPHMCQMFPLQLIPREQHAILTLRRACPSAAADEGRTLEEHLPEVQRLVKAGELTVPVAERQSLNTPAWRQANRVMAAAARIFGDERFPPVRRVVHALLFARLLEKAKLHKLDETKTNELIHMLEAGVVGEATPLFADRKPPSSIGGLLFRLTVAEYIRLHPDYRPPAGIFARYHLFHSIARMLRGKGPTPPLHPTFPQTTFAVLDEPLQSSQPALLRPELQRPIERYLALSAASYQYAFAARSSWTVLQSIRSLAMSFPVALYLVRWATAGREPTLHDVARVVATIDRGQGYSSLSGARYRSVLTLLEMQEDLEKLAVWYAR
jgi:lysine-N-methylase